MRGAWIAVVCVLGCTPAEGTETGTDTEAATDTDVPTGPASESSTETSMSGTTSVPTTSIGPESSGEASGSGSTSGPMPVDCSAIEAESAQCVTADGTNLHLVGLDSGDVCTFAMLDLPFNATSIAWLDDVVLGCGDPELSLLSADPVAGTVTDLGVACQAVARHPDGIVLLPSTASMPALYPTVDAIVGDDATEVFGFDPTAARITVGGDTLYSSWHVTQAVQLWDLASSTYVMDVALEEFDDGVGGLAIVGSTLAVLGPPEAPILHLFDAASGMQLEAIELPDLDAPIGLACR